MSLNLFDRMTRGQRLYALLFAVMLAVYLAIVLWALPAISRGAGGLVPFDLRPTGYSAEAARTFLAALTPQGRALYLGPQKWLDMAYPALLAAVLALAFWHLISPRLQLLRVGLVSISVAAAGFDYLENIRVRLLLLASPDAVTDAMAQAASFATVMKSALASVAFMALLVVLIHRGWRWLRERRRP